MSFRSLIQLLCQRFGCSGYPRFFASENTLKSLPFTVYCLLHVFGFLSVFLRHYILMVCLKLNVQCFFSADPLVGSIAQQYLTDRKEHDNFAKDWTKRFAT